MSESKLQVAEMFCSLPNTLTLGQSKRGVMKDCPECAKNFDNERGLKVHVGKKHPSIELSCSSKEDRECVICGTEFTEYQSVAKKTCSKKCSDELKSQSLNGRNTSAGGSSNVVCENCGDKFLRWNSQIEKYENHFCSKECHNEWRTGRDSHYIPKRGHIESDKLTHSVRSGWEVGVAELFVENDIKYEYEPQKFDVDGVGYIPDFIVDDTVIEVKGRPDDSGNKVEKFESEYPEYRLVVIGADLDVETRIPYSKKEQIVEVLDYE